MLTSLLALQVMTVAWFFDLHIGPGSLQRFGPYLTEGTCDAVRERIITRAQVVSHDDARTGAPPCFKVVVQENESAIN